MPLLTPNHNLMTCGVPEAFTSTTIFKKRGEKTSNASQERYILKGNSPILSISVCVTPRSPGHVPRERYPLGKQYKSSIILIVVYVYSHAHDSAECTNSHLKPKQNPQRKHLYISKSKAVQSRPKHHSNLHGLIWTIWQKQH